jgi:hypothetical protein
MSNVEMHPKMIENLKKIAAVHAADLDEICKDLKQLSRYLKKTDIAEEEKFKSNMVTANFYLQAIQLGTMAFNIMMQDEGANPSNLGSYFEKALENIKKEKEKTLEKNNEGEENDNND